MFSGSYEETLPVNINWRKRVLEIPGMEIWAHLTTINILELFQLFHTFTLNLLLKFDEAPAQINCT